MKPLVCDTTGKVVTWITCWHPVKDGALCYCGACVEMRAEPTRRQRG